MWILSVGQRDTCLRNVEELRREYVAEINALLEAEGETPLTYKTNEDLAGLSVRLRGVNPSHLEAYRLAEAERRESGASSVEAQRALVASSVCEVQGIEGPTGDVSIKADGDDPLPDGALDDMQSVGLVETLATLVSFWQSLPTSKKKHCGTPQQ